MKMLTISPYFHTVESPYFWFEKVGSPVLWMFGVSSAELAEHWRNCGLQIVQSTTNSGYSNIHFVANAL